MFLVNDLTHPIGTEKSGLSGRVSGIFKHCLTIFNFVETSPHNLSIQYLIIFLLSLLIAFLRIFSPLVDENNIFMVQTLSFNAFIP